MRHNAGKHSCFKRSLFKINPLGLQIVQNAFVFCYRWRCSSFAKWTRRKWSRCRRWRLEKFWNKVMDLSRILHLYLQERFYIRTCHIRLFLKNFSGVIVTRLWLFGDILQFNVQKLEWTPVPLELFDRMCLNLLPTISIRCDFDSVVL